MVPSESEEAFQCESCLVEIEHSPWDKEQGSLQDMVATKLQLARGCLEPL